MILQKLIDAKVPWVDGKGVPTPDFFRYMQAADLILRSAVQTVEKYFTFADDGLTLNIGNIPAGALILKPISGIHVIQAFNAGSGNVADIGPSTNTDLWGTDLALGTIGFIPLDEAVSNIVAVGDSLAQVAVDLTGSAASTGQARAVISYIIPTTR